ncbi:MAG: YcaO-like family protein [Pseudonocardiales bacterium]
MRADLDVHTGAADPPQLLLDPRLGLLTRVRRMPPRCGVPRSLVCYAAQVAAVHRVRPWRADPAGYGAAFAAAAARAGAIGEAVERYCGNAVPGGLPRGSRRELRARGLAVLDPRELALFSARQYATPGFPFTPLDDELAIRWVRGRRLDDGSPLLVPASVVYLNFYRGPYRSEPPTNPLCYAGIATGPNRSAAERAALEELLERDAVALWWHARGPTVHLAAGSGPPLDFVHGDPGGERLTVTLLELPSVIGVPVVGAFVEDPERQLVAFGTACRADERAAAGKALAEACQSLLHSAELLDPNSAQWQAVRAGHGEQDVYAPVRPDRRYRDSFRTDWHDLRDLGAHAQLYLDPQMQGAVLDRFRRAAQHRGLADCPAVDGDPRAEYLARLATRGLRAVSIDLTTPDVAAAGLTVVRVVVPGLYGNAPAAFPYLGGDRLATEPVRRGWRDRPLREEELCCQPLPQV